MRTRRRLLVPEVVQTSAMDCGPASLKCLLEGFGIPVSYGRLREACQTDVDGTSIDTIEEAAVQLGLDAEQIMVPADHVLLAESQALPAILVVQLANGVTHFVVAWQRHGPLVQLIGPGDGPAVDFCQTVFRRDLRSYAARPRRGLARLCRLGAVLRPAAAEACGYRGISECEWAVDRAGCG